MQKEKKKETKIIKINGKSVKNYRQSKRAEVRKYVLEKEIYRKCINDIRCYYYYKENIEKLQAELNISYSTKKYAMLKKMQRECNKIEIASRVVPLAFRDKIIAHTAGRESYMRVIGDTMMTLNTLERYTQKFVYYYARENSFVI